MVDITTSLSSGELKLTSTLIIIANIRINIKKDTDVTVVSHKLEIEVLTSEILRIGHKVSEL